MESAAEHQSNLPFLPFIVRIVLPSGEATDWRVDSDITFHDVLVSIVFDMTPDSRS